jgi:hypothetical protein
LKIGDIAFRFFFCEKAASLPYKPLKSSAGNTFRELAEVFAGFADEATDLVALPPTFDSTISRVESLFNSNEMKQYLTEKNALTVSVSVFCFIMMIIAFVKDHSIWQGIAFALAFSFSIEVICHRAKEVKR